MNKKKHGDFRSSSMTLAAAIAIAVSNIAVAQQDEASMDSFGLEEIIVTARKRQESLQDVPLAISVTSQEQLQRDKIFNINDLSRTTPAVEVTQTFGAEVSGGGRIRGIGTGVFNQSVSPSVAFIVDQVPVGNTSFPSLYDLAQIETLRGPQGTLFGQGASAGVINVSTIAPDIGGEVSGKVGIDYAPDDSLGSESGITTFNGGLNIPLGETAAMRVSGQFREDEGTQTNTVTGNDARERYTNLRTRIAFQPTDSFKNDVKIEYGKLDQRNRLFLAFSDELVGDTPLFGPGSPTQRQLQQGCGISFDEDYPEEFCSDTDDDIEWESLTFSNVADWSLTDNLDLTSVTSYRTLEESLVRVNFSRAADPSFSAGDSNLNNKGELLSQEIRASFQGDGYDLIFGGYYQKYTFETRPLDEDAFLQSLASGNVSAAGVPLQDLGGTITGFELCRQNTPVCLDAIVVPGVAAELDPALPPPVRDAILASVAQGFLPTFVQEDTENTTFAIFADGTFQVTDNFDIFGGLRYTDYENTTEVGQQNRLNAEPELVLDTGEDNISGRLGFRFQPRDRSTYYGSVSVGYKPSAVALNDLPDDPATPEREDVSELDQEDSLAFELGAKYGLDNGMNIDANIFFTEVDGYQIQRSISQDATLFSIPDNSDIESYGIEISVYGRLTQNFSYNVGYLYNEATFTEDGFLGDDGRSLTGETLNLLSNHKLTASGEYTQSLGNNLQGFISSNLVVRSEFNSGLRADDILVQPGGANIGAAFGVEAEDGRWRFSIYGRNLTQYRELDGRFVDPGDASSRRGIARPGRTTRIIGATLDLNF